MSDESECRHLPKSAYDFVRCPKCGATLNEPINARLLAAAQFFASWCPRFSERYGAEHHQHLAAIADAERGQAPAWTAERPTVPGWYWFWHPRADKSMLIYLYFRASSEVLYIDLTDSAVADRIYDGGMWCPANIVPPPAPGGEA